MAPCQSAPAGDLRVTSTVAGSRWRIPPKAFTESQERVACIVATAGTTSAAARICPRDLNASAAGAREGISAAGLSFI